ncbi:ATP-dependent RNA helicase DHX29 [Leucoagaricus sp. SymC.cos]|nr:ATP-dependent RNA helicase DHX29 [Leucoagaricus sp. SymC.cos]
MAKKKKTQLKPVARGFATVSVPKKVTPPEDVEDHPKEASTASPVEDGADLEENGRKQSISASQNVVVIDEFESKKVEEQTLQNLVDRLQEKTEREIVRTLKGIETDRKFSRTLPRLELDSQLRDQILDLVKEGLQEEQRALDEPEDKGIARLGVTYGVLRRLGFSEGRVEECLRAINGVDLEEAYDWLYTMCDDIEISGSNDAGVRESKTPRTPLKKSSPLPETPRTPAQFLVNHTPTTKEAEAPSTDRTPSKLDAKAPAFIPSRVLLSGANSQASSDSDAPNPGTNTTSSPYESSDEDDPTTRYVRLRLEHEHMLDNRARYAPTQLQEIHSRLNDLQRDFLFNDEEAESMYQRERDRALLERLRGSGSPSPSPTMCPEQKVQKKLPGAIKIPQASLPASTSSSDVFDDANSDYSGGGLLDLLEELPATETSSDGIVITLKDMALPKHWAGRTPKVLLKEIVARKDRYAVITYNLISGSSRAKRISLSIRWDGTKSDNWSMDNVACPDQIQAEHYIALSALHSLTFPQSKGFASSSSGASNPTFFRLLPPTFRDLWDELEEARRLREDSTNRQVWAKLRSIIEPKIDLDRKAIGKQAKPVLDKGGLIASPSQFKQSETMSEQLISVYQALQERPAYQEMVSQRQGLPIAQYRLNIIEMLEHNQVLVLSGETGCGKSTQVPSFILEDQLSRGRPCRIYCTEPRRISAISLAQRVSRELGEPANAVGTYNSLVGYAIRLESNVTRNTRLAYVTNGIALRMLESGTGHGDGTAFDDLTHIIIDEVHERTIESDFLLIVLKSLLEKRSDLKVILMSATVDAEKISAYFGGCPTLHVPGRTFPVDVRWLEDAVEYTKWYITENSPYARRMHDKFYRGKKQIDWTEETVVADDEDEDQENARDIKLEKRYSQETVSTLNLFDERFIPYELITRILEKLCFDDPQNRSYSAAILIFLPGIGEIRRMNDVLNEHPQFGSEELFHIYPLHSTLSSENQSSVFEIPPLGVRKIVIATNIAETGITIPDITCVIDTGKHREMRFDEKRQISRLVETFVAKSNAVQRRGRAGRVQQGLCFHLFTKVRHDNQMVENPLPEMMRLSLSDLALRIKIMRVNLGSSIEDVLSRALDPPIAVNVQRAIAMLVEVRALTPNVHLGKFLLIATLFRCLDPALTIAAALNSKSPFLTPLGLEAEAERARATFRSGDSDFLTIHNAFMSWRKASANGGFVFKFCRQNYISHQNMQQIEELRQQFLGYLIDSAFIRVDKSVIRELNRARWNRGKSRFVTIPSELDIHSTNTAIVNAALVAGLYPKVLSFDSVKCELKTITNNQTVWMHPSSINSSRKLADMGYNYFNYFTLMHSKKLYAWELGPVDDLAMLLLCGDTEFRLFADIAAIDRSKVRFNISPKSNVALKYLRMHMSNILASQFRGRSLDQFQTRWKDIGMAVLAKIKTKEEDATLINLRAS